MLALKLRKLLMVVFFFLYLRENILLTAKVEATICPINKDCRKAPLCLKNAPSLAIAAIEQHSPTRL